MREEHLLSEEEFALLEEEKLEQILGLPAIRALCGKRIYREQKFLVSVPAKEILQTAAEDEIVLQGAIDLLCEDGDGWLIIDYKFSSHDAEELKATYARQIEIYRKAVSRVMHVDESAIRARIVNIKRLFEVEM